MNIGYARVSTGEQNLDLQKDALHDAMCTQIFEDHISGAKQERPGLRQALAFLREGDTLVVWRLDRLGRSLKHLIEIIEELSKRGIHFKSLMESIETASPAGKLIFHIFSSLAEFERSLISERTMAGLRSARARGRTGGRPPAWTPQKIKTAQTLLKAKNIPVSEICKTVGVGRSTLYRRFTPEGELKEKTTEKMDK